MKNKPALDIKAIKKRLSKIPKSWAWDKDDDYVHQGSHLGNTLISLDDTYEKAQEHCDFIENAPRDIQSLLDEVARLNDLLKDKK